MSLRNAKPQMPAVIVSFDDFEIFPLVHYELVDKAPVLTVVAGEMVGKQGTDIDTAKVKRFHCLK